MTTTTAVSLTSTIVPTNTPTYTPLLATADCQFPVSPDETIQSGYLTVPEDRANPQRTIRLHVAIIDSHSDTPAPDPVIFLSGGPGGYTLEIINCLLPFTGDISAERDLILFDQRGVGYSEPSLDCPELEEAWLNNIEKPLDADEWLAVDLAATAACHDRLVSEGVNLSVYHSKGDMKDHRRKFSPEQWRL